MTPRTRHLPWFALALAAVGAAWLALARDEATPPRRDAGTAQGRLQWRVGSDQQYQLLVDATIRVGGDSSHAPPMRQMLRGTLGCRTLDVGDDGALVGMRLSPAELLVDGDASSGHAADLTRPFRVSFTADGTIDHCDFPAEVPVAHRRLLEEAVRTFQVVWRDAQTWSTEEQHATGRYAAHYETLGDGRGRRRKLHYLASQPPGRAVAVHGATAEWRLAPGTDWLAGMTVDERLVTQDDTGVVIDVVTHATLNLLPATEPTVSTGTWNFEAASHDGADGPVRSTGAFTDRSPQQLAAALAEMLTALDGAAEGRAVWIHRLRELVRADDRVPDLLLARLQAAAHRDRTHADVFLVLELGGTPAAQRALSQVADGAGWPHPDRSRALIALGGVEHADAATWATLWARARNRQGPEHADLANTAMLALGSLAGRTPADAEAASNVRGGLLSEAWGGADPGQRAVAILALANTGDHSLTTELLPLLDDRTSEVRRAAAKALGKLGDAATSLHLARRLPHEPDSAVRAGLASALANQTAPSAEILTVARSSIAQEPDEVTRLQLARVLTKDLAAHAENVATLREVLVREPSDRVRRCIGEALAKLDTPRR